MERLTSRTPAGVANLDYPQNCFYPDGTKDQVAVSAYRQKAIDRLAAYEDTGLMPERVAELSQAEKDGRLVVLPPNDPLTIEELREIIEQLEQCGYECEAGSLVMNAAFIRLKEFVYRRKPEETV